MNIEFLIKVFDEFGYRRCFKMEENLKKQDAFNTYDTVFSFYNPKKVTYFIVTIDNIKNKNQVAISIPFLNFAVFKEDTNKIFSKFSSKMRSPIKALKGHILYLFENIKNIERPL